MVKLEAINLKFQQADKAQDFGDLWLSAFCRRAKVHHGVLDGHTAEWFHHLEGPPMRFRQIWWAGSKP
jgi:hypothetical protein